MKKKITLLTTKGPTTTKESKIANKLISIWSMNLIEGEGTE